jgi:biotin carboxyl carrier protein
MIAAPMPAKVSAILFEPGQLVSKGDVLLKLEAMKMELPVRAPRDGAVKTVSCKVGELVQPGVALMELA